MYAGDPVVKKIPGKTNGFLILNMKPHKHGALLGTQPSICEPARAGAMRFWIDTGPFRDLVLLSYCLAVFIPVAF